MTDNKDVMQQALRAFNLYLDWDGKDSSMLATFDIAANIVRDKLNAAIAQPEQPALIVSEITDAEIVRALNSTSNAYRLTPPSAWGSEAKRLMKYALADFLKSRLLAQPEQPSEPVAWMKRVNIASDWDMYDFSANQYGDFQIPLYKTPNIAQPEQPATVTDQASELQRHNDYMAGFDEGYKRAQPKATT